LDYRFKGLDRAIEGMRWISEQAAAEGSTVSAELPIRLFLCGPDYRGGAEASRRHVEQAGLQNDVVILGPDEYTPGSKKPLRDADATVLLSRWDGSPRTLREAASYGTPMIVSEETNFADLVRSDDAGLVVDGDDAAAVGRAFLAMADCVMRDRMAAGSRRLGERSTWEEIGADLLRQGRALV
jgi:glycosyltransferase involved in cell wall biosynthesis